MTSLLRVVLFLPWAGIMGETLNNSLIISYEDRLEVLDGLSKSVIEKFSLSPRVNYIVGLTTDGKDLFISDYEEGRGTTIFKVGLDRSEVYITPLVEQNSLNLAEGVAYDSIEQVLYFSDSVNQRILSLPTSQVPENSTSNSAIQTVRFFESTSSKVRDVAIDSCTKRLYWVDWNPINPRIESVLLNNSTSSIIVQGNLTRPRSLIFDYWGPRLYWIDVQENNEFKIERANSNGENRQIVCKGYGNSPFDVAVSKEHVYWSDWMNMVIWRVDKNGGNEAPVPIRRLTSSRPMGIVSLSFPEKCIQHRVPSTPSVVFEASTSDFKINTTSSPFTDNICLNYCLHGSCSLTAVDIPICYCDIGFRGSRCQNDLCHNYCLNGGICRLHNLDVHKDPSCQCPDLYSGSRCQIKSHSVSMPTLESCNGNVLMYGFVFMSSLTGVLLCIILRMTFKLWQRKKSSNINTFSKNSEEFLPSSSDEGDRSFNKLKIPFSPRESKINKWKKIQSSCDRASCSEKVDIEDCCHMTLCDTPCVEATFRKPRRRGKSQGEDDSKALINNDFLIKSNLGDIL